MGHFLKSRTGRIILCIIAVIIGLISFFSIGEKVSSPETFKTTIEKLDEKKINVAEMTAITTGTSVVIGAVPGDATTPVANKLADLSGYLLIVTTLILCEKYLLTLSGMLAFKILIPIAALAIVIYLLSGYERYKGAAVKILAFAIAFFLVVPSSVYVSDKVEEVYEISSEYSIEQAKEDQAEIEAKAKAENAKLKWYDKIVNQLSSGFEIAIDKAENMMNHFIDFMAVMFITNLIIPVGVFFILLKIIKAFTGRDYSGNAISGAKKMNSIIHKNNKLQS